MGTAAAFPHICSSPDEASHLHCPVGKLGCCLKHFSSGAAGTKPQHIKAQPRPELLYSQMQQLGAVKMPPEPHQGGAREAEEGTVQPATTSPSLAVPDLITGSEQTAWGFS